MNINADDPKWTAYVLGELDATERAALELELEASEEAREFVEELRMAASIMKDGLASEAAFELTAGQRAQVRASAQGVARTRWFSPQLVWAAGLAAACVLIAVTFIWTVRNPQPRQQTAQVIGDASAPYVEPKISASPVEESTPEARAKDASQSAAPSKLEALSARAAQPTNAIDTTAALTPTATISGVTVKAEKTAPVDESIRETRSAAASQPAARSELEARSARTAQPATARDATAVLTTTGTISGVVSDYTNALIPGVAVKVENAATGMTVTALSDAAGAYRFANLPAGTYRITAQLAGFRTATLTNVVTRSDQEARADLKLQVASVNQSVEVALAPEALRKETSAPAGQVLPSGAKQQELPLVGNNVLDLVRVLPSVVATPPPPPSAGPRMDPNLVGEVRTITAPVDAEIGRQQAQQGGGGGGRGGAGGRGFTQPVVVSSALAPATASTVILPATSFADAPVAPPVGAYDRITDNPFIAVSQQQLSTFSADVDTASYANVRRFLNQNQLPPRDAVRIEELVNYFSYDYPQATGPHPITGSMDVAAAPWNPQHRLVRIGIKAKDVRISQKASNLVLLIDVSGSMGTPERLPLLKSGMRMLIDRLSENDKISIVTYAAGSGIALQPTSGDRKDVILQAIENLHAEGGTNGGAGIQTAYEMAVANFIRSGVNRVILATDGDFNVGITDPNQLTRLIEDRARSGVYLTVLGFGNNFKDSLLGRLADKGHGNYSYIDSLNEARKVLVEQIDSTLVTVAKDVKIQVEFNPAQVNAYRLLGYENRLMQAADFNNDLKDAGDMGSGHTVTALYEVVPRGVDVDVADGIGAPLRYQQPTVAARADVAASREMLNLRIRYKQPEGGESKLLEVPLIDRGAAFTNANADFRFASAVAGFGMILRDSPYKGSATLDWVLATATNNRGSDKNGYRAEFIRLVQQAMRLRR